MEYFVDTLFYYENHCNDKQDCIGEADKYRAFFIAVCIVPCCLCPCKAECHHGQDKRSYVAQVVSGIRQQPHRTGKKAVNALYGYKQDVQYDSCNECGIERFYLNVVLVRMAFMFMFAIHGRQVLFELLKVVKNGVSSVKKIEWYAGMLGVWHDLI